MTAEVFSDLINHRISLRKFVCPISLRATVERGRVVVTLKLATKDVNGGPGTLTLEFSNIASSEAIESMTTATALRFIRTCVHHAVLHEADECIELDFAKRPFDPHAGEEARRS